MGDALGRTAKDLEATNGRLEEVCSCLDETRQGLLDTQDKVGRCGQGQESSRGAVQQLQAELRDLRQQTQAVRAGLKEQSSLLLPNIHMDSSEARTAAARHGSLLTGGAGGGGGAGAGNGSFLATGRTSPAHTNWR